MRFAYADPPYLGQSRRYPEHNEAHSWDNVESHHALLRALPDWFPDGWAFSLSSTSLRNILPAAPADVRIMAWVKPFAIFKPNVNPGYTWEPVLVSGGRKLGRDRATVRDWCSVPITLQTGTIGAKPQAFNDWLLSVFGYESGDELIDLFPGSGGMERVLMQERMTL